jgi:hypothetical protein
MASTSELGSRALRLASGVIEGESCADMRPGKGVKGPGKGIREWI